MIALLIAFFTIGLLGCNQKDSSIAQIDKPPFTSSIETSDNEHIDDLMIDNTNIPENVLDIAKQIVTESFTENKLMFPAYNYVEWRLKNLTYSYTYEDLKGMKLVIYQMNYEFLSDSPEKIRLVGGMYITQDNWVMPNYPNATYLIFNQQDGKLSFQHVLLQNDCQPGDPLFTEDLVNSLD